MFTQLNKQWTYVILCSVHIDCVLDIQQWSNSHCFKLDVAKPEVIWFGTHQQLAKLSHSDLTLSIGDSALQPSTVVRKIDGHLSMAANARHCASSILLSM